MSQQPIRVLQILPALHVGGVERGTLDWALALKQMGHTPIVVSAGGHGVDLLKQHDIEHVTMAVGKKSLRSLVLIKKLRQLFQDFQVDVVHARSRMPAWLSYWAIKQMKDKPAFVTTLHGLHTVSPYASVMAKGDAVIAVSETAKTYLKTHFKKHLKTEPVVVFRGIDSSEFPNGYTASDDWLAAKHKAYPLYFKQKKVLLPGRLSEIKGAMGLIPWLKGVKEGVCLMVNAKPEDSKFSREFAAKLVKHGISDRVVWLGVERDMKQLYAWADVVLSVNKKPESFGRTVLEALTVGCPVLAFNQGGVSEVMSVLFPQGLVPVNDWNALTEKIDAFIKAVPVVPAHQSFSLQMQFEQTMQVYQKVLAKK